MANTRHLNSNEATTQIPPVKLAAILALFNQILLTKGDEAQRIIDRIRGRRSALPFTFGELHNLAVGEKIAAQAKAAEVENLGEAPSDLARVLLCITPDLAICENCHKYPIEECGGIISFKTNGRCPHCNQGLITKTEQEEPYRAWTTLSMMSPSATHDRDTMPHLSLPTRNDVILKEAGLGMYTIDDGVRDALKKECLITGDGVIDVSHLLAFLAHGPLMDRFRGIDEVLIALGDPKNFGAHDFVSVCAVVREAKQWTPNSATTYTAITVRSFSTDGMLLDDLFVRLFQNWELLCFVEKVERGLKATLPGENVPPVRLAGEAMTVLTRRGLVNTRLFDLLLKERPGRFTDILACQQRILG